MMSSLLRGEIQPTYHQQRRKPSKEIKKKVNSIPDQEDCRACRGTRGYVTFLLSVYICVGDV